MITTKRLPYKITCPFCHAFDTFNECKELEQSSIPPHYLFPTGNYAVVCTKCGAKFSNMELEAGSSRRIKDSRPAATILKYKLLELPVFLRGERDFAISTLH